MYNNLFIVSEFFFFLRTGIFFLMWGPSIVNNGLAKVLAVSCQIELWPIEQLLKNLRSVLAVVNMATIGFQIK